MQENVSKIYALIKDRLKDRLAGSLSLKDIRFDGDKSKPIVSDVNGSDENQME